MQVSGCLLDSTLVCCSINCFCSLFIRWGTAPSASSNKCMCMYIHISIGLRVPTGPRRILLWTFRVQTLRRLLLPGHAAKRQRSRLDVVIADYASKQDLKVASKGVNYCVHLVGILKETPDSTYENAHEDSCQALTEALQGGSVAHISYVSIVGALETATNRCLKSKSIAGDMLLKSTTKTMVLRVPMVLGEGDYASYALRRNALKSLNFLFRPSSMDQPLYAGDVVRAIKAGAVKELEGAYDLVGPEPLSRRDLIKRTASMLGRRTKVVGLPIALGLILSGLLEKLFSNPPVTRSMLEVLDHDDNMDTSHTEELLKISPLVSLDAMLEKILNTHERP